MLTSLRDKIIRFSNFTTKELDKRYSDGSITDGNNVFITRFMMSVVYFNQLLGAACTQFGQTTFFQLFSTFIVLFNRSTSFWVRNPKAGRNTQQQTSNHYLCHGLKNRLNNLLSRSRRFKQFTEIVNQFLPFENLIFLKWQPCHFPVMAI